MEIGKNKAKWIEKKISNKFKQAQFVIEKAEGRLFEDIKSDIPTDNVLFFHFGNGDENDQNRVLEVV